MLAPMRRRMESDPEGAFTEPFDETIASMVL
jgi:hypothetical protein